MATRDNHRIVETPTEARQGEPGPSVLALLAVSLGLAVLVLAVVWFVFFRTLMRPGWSDPRGGVKHTLIPLGGGRSVPWRRKPVESDDAAFERAQPKFLQRTLFMKKK